MSEARRRTGKREREPCLDISGAPVERQLQVFDLAKVGELIANIVLGRLLMDAADEDDPALDSCNKRLPVNEKEIKVTAKRNNERKDGRSRSSQI